MTLRLCLAVVFATLPALAGAAETDKYLPNATEAIVTVNVKQFLEAPLFKDNLDAVKQVWKQVGFDQAITECLGLDPFQDLERVQVALMPNPDNEPGVILLLGGFDVAKVRTTLEKANKPRVESVTHEGRQMHRVRFDKDDPEKVMYVSPLDQGVVVLSTDPNRIHEALEKKEGKRKAELRKDVQNLLARVDAKHAVSVASLSRPLNFGGLLGNAPGNLQNVTGGVVLGDDLKLELALTARDPAGAKAAANSLEDQLNQLKAVVAVLVTQQKKFSTLADLVNGAKISSKGSDVAFRLTISKELIETVFKKE